MTVSMLGKRIKDNSKRKFTGGGRRPDKNEAKRAEAKRRNDYFASLSPARQLANLDARLGVGVGAKRQRARIARST